MIARSNFLRTLLALFMALAFTLAVQTPVCADTCGAATVCDCPEATMHALNDTCASSECPTEHEPTEHREECGDCDCTCACHAPTALHSASLLKSSVLPLLRARHVADRISVDDGLASKIHQPPKLSA